MSDANELRRELQIMCNAELSLKERAEYPSDVFRIMEHSKQLNAACSAGRPPSEYLRALAKRAREKAGVVGTSRWRHRRRMADTLEAWADE